MADLEMPGNDDLSLVREFSARHGNLPIIIVTGYPSMRTALACIDLPVSAYLLKPVAFDDMVARIDQAVARYRAYRRADERLEQWREDLANVSTPGRGSSTDAFMRLALRNVMGSLTDVEQVALRSGTPDDSSPHTCQVLNCPRGAQLVTAIRQTVHVLEETRSSFKSTQLRDLRRQLVLLLEHP
jgi:response regulator RpfG family c-di-GMP phosphodiesterase